MWLDFTVITVSMITQRHSEVKQNKVELTVLSVCSNTSLASSWSQISSIHSLSRFPNVEYKTLVLQKRAPWDSSMNLLRGIHFV